jgi:hypothetical protein
MRGLMDLETGDKGVKIRSCEGCDMYERKMMRDQCMVLI